MENGSPCAGRRRTIRSPSGRWLFLKKQVRKKRIRAHGTHPVRRRLAARRERMRVGVFWVGKTRLPGVAALTEEYSRRLGRYCEFHGEEVRAARRKVRGTRGEEEAILARSTGTYRVVLDPSGRQWTSLEFARFLRERREGGSRGTSFCVGGAEGFSRPFRQEANLLLSLSPLTLPHELARVVLLEQLYRAFTMLAHHPYPR